MAQAKARILLDNGQYLTVADNTSFPLTFSIADIRDLSKRKGTFSKTITIPGSKSNNKILGNLYDINVTTGSFNINTITNCVVEQNGIVILENAVMQLIDVKKIQTNNNHEEGLEYSVLIKDTLGDFFSTIGSKKLSDLTLFSGAPRTFLAPSYIIDSWANDYTDDFKFLIPYTNPSSTDPTRVRMEEIYPAIYANTYFEGIFSEAGYSFTWDTIDDPSINFRKLLIPYNGEEFKGSPSAVENSLVDVSGNTPENIVTNIGKRNIRANIFEDYVDHSNSYKIFMPTEMQDFLSLWNQTTSNYTTPFVESNKELSITATINFTFSLNNPNAFNVYMKGCKFDNNNSSWQFINTPLRVTPVINVFQNGQLLQTVDISKQVQTTIASVINYKQSVAPGNNIIFTGELEVPFTVSNITAGAQLFFAYQIRNKSKDANSDNYFAFYDNPNALVNDSGAIRENVKYNFNITSSHFEITTLKNISYDFNTPIFLQDFLVKDIKQSDFLKSIFTMFNIYAEVNPSNPKNIILTPRDVYYDTGEILDLTNKIVKDQNQTVKFLPELQSKRILLTYKDDDAEDLKLYKTTTGEIYGQQEYIFTNEYSIGQDKKELIFAPTTMMTTAYDAVLPVWNGISPKMTIRIVYDGGTYSCSKYKIDYEKANGGSLLTEIVDTYPLATHWNHPSDPTFDINFGLNDYYLLTSRFTPTGNNLFNLNWRRTLNQINSGKMLTALFHLDENIMSKLRLNAKIKIDNSWWNINKISDYDANNNTPTKIELISIDDDLKIAYSTRPVTELRPRSPRITRVNNWFGQITLPYRNTISPVGGWILEGDGNVISNPIGGGIIIGDWNTTPRATRIFGNENLIGDGVGGFIVGDNNYLEGENNNIFGKFSVASSGISNTTIIGDFLTAQTSNALITNNIVISGTVNGTPINTIATVKFPDTGAIIYNGAVPSGSTGVTISSCIGYIADCESNPTAVTQTKIVYTGQTLQVPTLSSGTATYILLGKGQPVPDATDGSYGGEITFQNTFPTSAQRKEKIWLSKIAHPQGSVLFVLDEVDFLNSPVQQFRDLFQAFNYINDGVYPYANSGLTFSVTNGNIHGNGINFADDRTTPNELTVGPIITTPFLYRTQTGGTTGFITNLDPTMYDLNGTITPVGGGINNTTIQYIFFVPGGGFLIQYGQNIYPTFAEAVQQVGRESFVQFANLINNAILVGVVVFERGVTDVTDTTECLFFRADKLGQIIGAAGGSSTSTLQSAYDNSLAPQIVLNSTLGALQIKGYSNVGGTPAFQILSSAGTPTFTVGEFGIVTASTLTVTSITAGTISATTYQNLPFWASGTSDGAIRALQSVSLPNIASGSRSMAIGQGSTASGVLAYAQGNQTFAIGSTSHAQGEGTQAIGLISHAEGAYSIAGGSASHAEGNTTIASGDSSHAEGFTTFANGNYSHAEGQSTSGTGIASHAEGQSTLASGLRSHAEGYLTQATGDTSHAEGFGSRAYGQYSHCEGDGGNARGYASHAEGELNEAFGEASHAEGFGTQAPGFASHSEGWDARATNDAAHAEGRSTVAQGQFSHAEGQGTRANALATHAEGNGSIAQGQYSHAQNLNTIASGYASHAEGELCVTRGDSAHAEGQICWAIGDASHAQGFGCTATTTGLYGHAGGDICIVSGAAGTTYGRQNVAGGNYSHAGGINSRALGLHSFVHGSASTANGTNTIVLGALITGNSDNTTYVDRFNIKTLGTGTSITNLGIDSSGNIVTGAGSGTTGLPLFVNSTGGTASGIIETIYREGDIFLTGGTRSIGTTPTIGSDFGSSFGHIFGGGTTGFIQLLGTGPNGGKPNVFVGMTSGASLTTPQMTFTAISGLTYNGYPTGNTTQLIYRFANGYLTLDNLIDIQVGNLIFYKYPGTRSDGAVSTTNYLATDSTGRLVSKQFASATLTVGTLNATTISATNYVNTPFWQAGTGTGALETKDGNNNALGNYSLAIGTGTTASGDFSFSRGTNTSATTKNSEASGAGIKTNTVAELARGYNPNPTGFTGQFGIIDLVGITNGLTTAPGQELFIGGQPLQRMIIPTGSTYTLDATVIVMKTGATMDNSAIKTTHLITNSAGTITEVQFGTTTTLGNFPLPSAPLSGRFSINFSGSTNNELKVLANSTTATTLQWYVTLDYKAMHKI